MTRTTRGGRQIVRRRNMYGQPLKDSTTAVRGKIVHMADRSVRTAAPPLWGTQHLELEPDSGVKYNS